MVFSAKEGKHVNVHIDMTGLPKDEGPFSTICMNGLFQETAIAKQLGCILILINASPVCDEQKRCLLSSGRLAETWLYQHNLL